MKEHIKFLVMLLVISFTLYLSYVISFVINGIYQLDAGFNTIAGGYETIFYLIVIKLFVFVLFMIYQKGSYLLSRGALGMVTGNLCAIVYIVFVHGNIQNYGIYSLNIIIDLMLVVGVLYLLNIIYKRLAPSLVEDQQVLSTEQHLENHYINKDLEQITQKLDQKKRLLEQIEQEIEQKQEVLKTSADNVRFHASSAIELPVRIEIGDKAKYFEVSKDNELSKEEKKQKNKADKLIHEREREINTKVEEINTKVEEINIKVEEVKTKEEIIRVKEEEIKGQEEALKNKEEDLKVRYEHIEIKEEIIEKTIANLEQISKNIKDRMSSLEDKEEYIRKQLEIADDKKEDQGDDGSRLQKQMYETIFKSPDILDEEVKLKDEGSEIIIDKNDLMEIRQLIEEASSDS